MIHCEVACAKNRLFACHLRTMAQDSSNSGEKFSRTKRLCDVIVGAKVQGRYLGILIGSARKHDDRQDRPGSSKVSDDLKSIDVREAEIEEQQVDVAVSKDRLQGAAATRSFGNRIALG